MSAEYVITEKSNLQTIADAVRTSTGNTDKFNVSELSSAVVTTIEEGEVTSEVGTYTNLLSQLETTIDTLPDAGSGGGSMEMCTVQITGTLKLHSVGATVYSNGTISDFRASYVRQDGGTELTIENVICNSTVVVDTVGGVMPSARGENAEILYASGTFLVKVTAPSGGTATITTYDDD